MYLTSSERFLYHVCQAQFLSLQINKAKNEKVENLNKIFAEVQRDVKSVSKSVAPEPKKQMQVYSLLNVLHLQKYNFSEYKVVTMYLTHQVVREPPKESVNVDNAAQLFSQL